MLLQLDNTGKENIDKLLAFARQNNMKLSLIDEAFENYALPGKPLTNEQLTQLVEKSRRSGSISMKDAHNIIRQNYNGD